MKVSETTNRNAKKSPAYEFEALANAIMTYDNDDIEQARVESYLKVCLGAATTEKGLHLLLLGQLHLQQNELIY
ncbi:Uncharacterised protein [Citrobacter freundii]|nr:Uncharacterised protein [Citrobacter freundii]